MTSRKLTRMISRRYPEDGIQVRTNEIVRASPTLQNLKLRTARFFPWLNEPTTPLSSAYATPSCRQANDINVFAKLTAAHRDHQGTASTSAARTSGGRAGAGEGVRAKRPRRGRGHRRTRPPWQSITSGAKHRECRGEGGSIGKSLRPQAPETPTFGRLLPTRVGQIAADDGASRRSRKAARSTERTSRMNPTVRQAARYGGLLLALGASLQEDPACQSGFCGCLAGHNGRLCAPSAYGAAPGLHHQRDATKQAATQAVSLT